MTDDAPRSSSSLAGRSPAALPVDLLGGWAGLDPTVLGLAQWPDHVDAGAWQRLFGRPPRGVLVLVDEQVGESHGQLRALPLLRALGVTRFTFADGWRGLDLAPFEWRYVGRDSRVDDLVGALPVCQFVSQRIEDASDGDAAYKLLRAHERAGPDALLIYVVDTPAFTCRRDPGGKSFVDEHQLATPRAYRPLAERFAHAHGLGAGEAMRSYNLLWQGLSRFVSGGVAVRRLEDVLSLLHHGAGSPIVPLYEHLCDLAGPEADADAVRRGLRSWIDRDITRVLDEVVLSLRRVGFRSGQVRAHIAGRE